MSHFDRLAHAQVWYNNKLNIAQPAAIAYPVDAFQQKEAAKIRSKPQNHTEVRLVLPVLVLTRQFCGVLIVNSSLILSRSRNDVSQEHAAVLATQKFFENDGKVLRFYCVWDDKESNERRTYVSDVAIDLCDLVLDH